MTWLEFFGDVAQLPGLREQIIAQRFSSNFVPMEHPTAHGNFYVNRVQVDETFGADYPYLNMEIPQAYWKQYGLDPNNDHGYVIAFALDGDWIGQTILMGDPSDPISVSGTAFAESLQHVNAEEGERYIALGTWKINTGRTTIHEKPPVGSVWKDYFQGFVGVVGTFAALIATAGAASPAVEGGEAATEETALAAASAETTQGVSLGSTLGDTVANVSEALQNVGSTTLADVLPDAVTNLLPAGATTGTLGTAAAGIAEKIYQGTGSARPPAPYVANNNAPGNLGLFSANSDFGVYLMIGLIVLLFGAVFFVHRR